MFIERYNGEGLLELFWCLVGRCWRVATSFSVRTQQLPKAFPPLNFIHNLNHQPSNPNLTTQPTHHHRPQYPAAIPNKRKQCDTHPQAKDDCRSQPPTMPPQTPTPSTNPATKRRRIEAANATLRKPFRSPLVARQQQASGTGAGTGAGGEGSPTVTRSTAAGSEAAHPTTPEPGRYGLGGGGRSAGVDGGTNAGAGQVSPAGLKRKFANTKPKSAAASSSTTQREGVREGDDLLVQLYAAQKHLVSDVRAAETRLEVVRQARGIEEAMGSVVEGGDAREGREGGVDFGELVGRW